MREVRSCDFCGTDATGLYEPLPASIPDGPRMALCSGCRDRLASVVDPLLDRIEAAPDATESGSEPIDAREWPDEPVREDGDGTQAPTDAPEPPAAPASSASHEVGESRDASGRAQRDRARTPHGYRKVMRFLENRSFPMERAEAERLAAEAYDLESVDVADAIDHAVQYGRLREVRGELKR